MHLLFSVLFCSREMRIWKGNFISSNYDDVKKSFNSLLPRHVSPSQCYLWAAVVSLTSCRSSVWNCHWPCLHNSQSHAGCCSKAEYSSMFGCLLRKETLGIYLRRNKAIGTHYFPQPSRIWNPFRALSWTVSVWEYTRHHWHVNYPGVPAMKRIL